MDIMDLVERTEYAGGDRQEAGRDEGREVSAASSGEFQRKPVACTPDGAEVRQR